MAKLAFGNQAQNKKVFYEAIINRKQCVKAVAPLELKIRSSLSNTLHDQLLSDGELQDCWGTIPLPGILPLPLDGGPVQHPSVLPGAEPLQLIHRPTSQGSPAPSELVGVSFFYTV